MKKRILIAMSVLIMSSFAVIGCSGNSEQKTSSQETQQTEERDVEDGQNGEQSTVCGNLDEVKDFMFVVTDDNQTSYAFTFEEKPEGLDKVSVGDRVVVTYTGTVSEVDAFIGEVLSVEKQSE